MSLEKTSLSELEKASPGQSTSLSSFVEEWTEAEEKILRNRMDWYIVPMVTVLYLMCFLDRCVTTVTKYQQAFGELVLMLWGPQSKYWKC
jgi:hypothetical protein